MLGDAPSLLEHLEISCARQKSCVVLRFVLDSVPFGTPTLSEFPDLGSHGLFLAFRRPKKKKTSRRLRSFKRISYEDLLPDPFQRIRRVSCFSGLLFFISTGISSGLNGSRTAEPRTPQDAEGRRRRLRSDRSRISYRAYRNRASILLVPDTSSDACPPPQLALNGTETEQGEIRIRKDYTHIREVKFSGSIGPLGEKRLCKIKCIGGQWVGPLCVDNHDNGRFHPLFRSCKLEYINPHLVVTFRNVSIHTAGWVFPHEAKLQIRCRELGLYKLLGTASPRCQNGVWSSRLPSCVPTTLLTNFTGIISFHVSVVRPITSFTAGYEVHFVVADGALLTLKLGALGGIVRNA
ncbi:hypothetical protein MTP99_013917 [Tenebrio molitor]|nr:hypothetical protein MTP99_013917 [Tenebrio molitor]